MKPPPHHGLTVDFEDWHQNVRMRLAGTAVDVSTDFADQVKSLLDFCDEANVRGTFFVLGRVARAVPSLVLEVARRGHEVACHSDEHRLLSTLTRAQFTEDTRNAKARLEDIVGARVVGYRAPEFSVGSLRHFAFEVLAELGFSYDSSVFPVSGARYGIPSAPRWPFELQTPSGALVELPLLSGRVLDVNFAAAGGSWYRVLPARVLAGAVAASERASGGVAILYFHPYEFATKRLWLHGDPWRVKLRSARYVLSHNLGTQRVARRLRDVLHTYRFGTLAPIADWVREQPPPTTTSNGEIRA